MDALIWEKPEEIDKKLAQRVSMVRQRKYITQEELSGLCDVSESNDIFPDDSNLLIEL